MMKKILLTAFAIAGSLLASDDPAALFVTDENLPKNMGFSEDSLLPDTPETKTATDVPASRGEVYMKIITDKKQFKPMVFHLWAWKFADTFIVKPGGKGGPTKYFHAGDETPWIPLHGKAEKNYPTAPTLRAVQGNVSWACTPLEESAFTVLFSTTPSEEGVFERVERSGRGCGISFRFRHTGKSFALMTDASESKKNAERLAACDPVKGKRPEKFRMASTLSLSDVHSEQILNTELGVLSGLGINTFGLGARSDTVRLAMEKYGFRHWELYGFGLFAHYKKNKFECLGRPDLKAMDAAAADLAKKVKESGVTNVPQTVCMMDEPWYSKAHVTECDYCVKAFPAYVEKYSGLKPESFGVKSVQELKPEWNPEKKELFYWTGRYFNHIMTEQYRAGTEAARRALPGIRTCVNFGTEATDNVLGHGNDWEEIFSTGALTYGVSEDWANLCGTYEVSGFQTALLRSVCGAYGAKHAMYDISYSGRTAWEIQAKAFTHIGQGADAITFFAYGPVYANADAGSTSMDFYNGVKTVTYAAGGAEDVLTGAESVRGDAALLWSRTGDVWSMGRKDGNHFGKERTTLFVLLQHCGIRSDILTESQLKTNLKNYSVLFLCDRQIEQACVPEILDFVQRGGTLVLTPGAFACDIYDREIPEISALNLPRKDFKLTPMRGYYMESVLASQKPDGTLKNGLRVMWESETLTGGTVLAAKTDDTPAMVSVPLGKGTVVLFSFFPGLSYFKDAKKTEKSIRGCYSSYPESARGLIAKIPNLKSLVKSSEPLVETLLLQNGNSCALVLSNWSGKVLKDVTVTLSEDLRCVKARGVRTAPELAGKILKIPELHSGDILTLTGKENGK